MNDITQQLIMAPFLQFQLQNQQAKEAIFEKFRAFYDKDWMEIEMYLKSVMVGKPFLQTTIDRMILTHADIIHKTLNRKSAGIYSQRPTRTLSDYITADDNLDALLDSSNYNKQIKSAFKKALFVNCVAVHFTYRNNKIDTDIYTPESFRVLPNEKDYLKADGIVMRRVNAATNEIYAEVWTLEENYLIIAGNKEVAGTNEEMINPYRLNGEPILPVVFLRMEDGLDFYGEPNWNLLLNQIAIDIKLSDNDYAEYFQKYKIPYGIDTGLKGLIQVDPGIMLNGESNGDKRPEFGVLDFQIDFKSLNDNIASRIRTVEMSEGLPESSSSISQGGAPKQVGAKTIDELELQESREEIKETLYKFEMNCLETLRVINNYHTTTKGNKLTKLNENYKFEVQFAEENPAETIDSKIKRRQYEKEYLKKDDIDFIMEDLELNEEDAIKYIQARQERKIKYADLLNNTQSNSQNNVTPLLQRFRNANQLTPGNGIGLK